MRSSCLSLPFSLSQSLSLQDCKHERRGNSKYTKYTINYPIISMSRENQWHKGSYRTNLQSLQDRPVILRSDSLILCS